MRRTLCLLLLLTLTAAVLACDDTVAPSVTAATDIQAAVDVLGVGPRVVCLQAGTYSGFGTALDLTTATTWVTLRGVGAATVLVGADTEKLLYVDEAGAGLVNMSITGFTDSGQTGASVVNIALVAGTAYLRGVEVSDCDSLGGIITNEGGTVTIESSVFTNIAGYVAEQGIVVRTRAGGTATIIDTLFTNTTIPNPKRGVVFIRNSYGSLINCTSLNADVGDGAGLAFLRDSTVLIANSTAASCVSGGEAGAIRLNAGFTTVTGCHFASNSALQTGSVVLASGVAPYLLMRDCVFVGNSGKGVVAARSDSVVDILRCTFYDNSGNQGVLRSMDSGILNVNDSVVVNNDDTAVAAEGTGGVNVTASTIMGNTGYAFECHSSTLKVDATTLACDNASPGVLVVGSCRSSVDAGTTESCSSRCSPPSQACVANSRGLFGHTDSYCDPADGPSTCFTCPICDVVYDECSHGTDTCSATEGCTELDQGFDCYCLAGYAGASCVDIDECGNGTHTCDVVASCGNTAGSFSCDCPDGYNTTNAGVNCSNVDECAAGSHNCDVLHASCSDVVGSFVCGCVPGYETVNDGVTCTDVDECVGGTHNCVAPSLCSNVPGGWNCSCPPGYNTTDGGVTCDDIDECATGGGHNCDPLLASCVNTVGSFNCTCDAGYTTNDGGVTCVDADECAVGGGHNCHAGLATCTNTLASFTCSCPSGYNTSDGGVTCNDIDECATGGGHNCDPALATCANTVGSFNCSCFTGFTTADGGVSCTDIDECSTNSHDCSMFIELCNNTVGSFVCESQSAGFDMAVSSTTTSEDGGAVTIELTLERVPSSSVSVAVSVSDSTEAVASTTSLVFVSNGTLAVVITGVDDTILDGDVAYTVSFGPAVSSDTAFNGATLPDVALTNTDNDGDLNGLTLSWTRGDGSAVSSSGVLAVGEGADPTSSDGLVAWVSLEVEPLATVTVAVGVSNTDVANVSTHALTFNPASWNVAQSVAVIGLDDNIVGSDVAFNVSFGPPVGAFGFSAGSPSLTTTVIRIEDDVAGVSLNLVSGAEYTTESGGIALVAVSLTAEPTAPVTITLASSNTDEGVVSSGPVVLDSSNWAAGVNSTTVTGVDDALLDFMVLYTVGCDSVVSADAAFNDANCSEPVLIPNVDNDDTNLLQLSNPSRSTTEASASTIAYVYVVLTADPGSLTVNVSVTSRDTSEVMVVSGADKLEFDSSNYFVPQAVGFYGVNDDYDDGNAVVTIDFVAEGIASWTAAVTNVDDDTAAVVLPANGGTTSELGDRDEFTVRLGSQPYAAVTVDFDSLDTSEGRVVARTSSLSFSTANWATPQTVTVVGVEDRDNDDGDVSYSVRARARSTGDSGYNGLSSTTTLINTNVVWPTVKSVLDSELSVLLGWPMAFEGEDFSAGCLAFMAGQPVRNLTRVSSKRLEFVSPVVSDVGYYAYRVVNPDGGVYEGLRTVFYTDDCPFPGQFGRGLDCVDCPEGGICPGGYRIWPDEGYWNPGEESGYVVACDPPERCTGGRDSECAAGYTGKMCSACQEGYFMEGKLCVQCSGSGVGVFLIVVDAVLYTVFVIAALVMPNAGFQACAYVLSMFQLLRMIGRMNLSNLPPFMLRLYRSLALTTGEGVRESGCTSGSSSFLYVFFMNYLLMAFTVVAIQLLIPLLRHCYSSYYAEGSPKRARFVDLFYQRRQISSLVVFAVFAYVNATTLNLQAVSCYRIPSGEIVLAADNTITCFVGNHVFAFAVGMTSLLLFSLGFPLAAGYMLHRYRKRLWTTTMMGYFGFMYHDFKPKYYLHQVAWLTLLLANAISVATMSAVPLFQLLFVGVLILAFFAYVAVARPFTEVWKSVVVAGILLVAAAALVYNYLVRQALVAGFVLTTFEACILTGCVVICAVIAANAILAARSLVKGEQPLSMMLFLGGETENGVYTIESSKGRLSASSSFTGTPHGHRPSRGRRSRRSHVARVSQELGSIEEADCESYDCDYDGGLSGSVISDYYSDYSGYYPYSRSGESREGDGGAAGRERGSRARDTAGRERGHRSREHEDSGSGVGSGFLSGGSGSPQRRPRRISRPGRGLVVVAGGGGSGSGGEGGGEGEGERGVVLSPSQKRLSESMASAGSSRVFNLRLASTLRSPASPISPTSPGSSGRSPWRSSDSGSLSDSEVFDLDSSRHGEPPGRITPVGGTFPVLPRKSDSRGQLGPSKLRGSGVSGGVSGGGGGGGGGVSAGGGCVDGGVSGVSGRGGSPVRGGGGGDSERLKGNGMSPPVRSRGLSCTLREPEANDDAPVDLDAATELLTSVLSRSNLSARSGSSVGGGGESARSLLSPPDSLAASPNASYPGSSASGDSSGGGGGCGGDGGESVRVRSVPRRSTQARTAPRKV